ncbi:MAG: ABC-F family ATP-binding cassette domain-containing protein [Ancrocorticia sp.]|uniref:ABC-F family ATP-binding cassette domain-containing protein n=1 Tax=Ancrocorticia sp. TaxID=2593684 RepID=UPI003F90990C
MHHSPSASSLVQSGSHLRVDGISFSFAALRVLTNVSFVVSAGDRVGLIGENGSGKSTLLRIIAGLLEPASGTITMNTPGGATAVSAATDKATAHTAARSASPATGSAHLDNSAASIGLLHQEFPFAPTDSIADALESAVAPARRAAAAVTDMGNAMAEHPEDQKAASAFAEALDTAERLDAWETDARISATIAGLGLDSIDRSRPTGTLSGGQRARLALGWLLLSTPDVLLLDEPTNHLDDAATAYLVSVLTAWRGPVLIASHDRAFLDDAATSLLDLDPSPIPHSVAGPLVQDGTGTGIGVTRFTGTYSDYLTEQAEAKERWQRQYRDEQAELKRLRSSVRDQHIVGHENWKPRSESRMAKKFYGDRNAKVVSRRVNDARSRLETLEEQQIRKPPTGLEFHGLTAAGNPNTPGPLEPVLVATDVSVANRLKPMSLSISRGEKWLITGANGSGKSTLLNVLNGNLPPATGQVTRAGTDRIKLLTQEIDLPDPAGRGPNRTALQAYTDLIGAQIAERVPLSTFGLIAGRDQNRPVAALSVGQQRRLALAVILADPPEILLLDEPTNHFSLGLVTALEDALADYPGTIVVASHDRWLRERWSGERFTLSGINDDDD